MVSHGARFLLVSTLAEFGSKTQGLRFISGQSIIKVAYTIKQTSLA